MDGVRKTFDKWAQNGKAEEMEEGHGKNVSKFLKTIPFDEKFTFLDVGCGTGLTTIPWKCKKYGIDPAKKLLESTSEI